LLAHFLGVAAPPEFVNRLSADQLKERTLNLVREVFLHASESASVVLIVENAHWIDPGSAAFLGHLAAGLRNHRLLLLLSTRPGFTAPWLAAPLVEAIRLESLDAGDVQGMVRSLRNPLYVKEILRQLQETGGVVVEDGPWPPSNRLRRIDAVLKQAEIIGLSRPAAAAGYSGVTNRWTTRTVGVT
jgi:predicted ATPase